MNRIKFQDKKKKVKRIFLNDDDLCIIMKKIIGMIYMIMEKIGQLLLILNMLKLLNIE